MSKSFATALSAIAATTALLAGAGTASAATTTADLFAYKLFPSQGAQCTIGVTNFGPDTVNVEIGPSNTFEKVYYKLVGPVAPGQSVRVDYDVKCAALESDKILYLGAFGFTPDGTAAADPNPANNLVPFVYRPAPTFGSSG